MMNWSSLLSSDRRDTPYKDKRTIRSPFERDYDRIIFSHPFRSLQDKTQVHPIPEHGFVHTRLTHSLEVSSVGRSLGRKVGESVWQRHNTLPASTPTDFGAMVAAASLAHDLGNPPFGHSGENAMSDFFINHPEGQKFEQYVSRAEWQDLIHFEGNAQGFRILNKKQYQGLRLTYGTLGAFTKYPYSSSNMPLKEDGKVGQKKYGFFQTEQALFENVATKLGVTRIGPALWARHPLAFLVEAADDICYSIIDLEDGCRLGLVSFDDTVALFAGILRDRFKPEKLNSISGQNEKIGALRALAIDQLIVECADVFLEHEDDMLNNEFHQPLTSQSPSNSTLKDIVDISHKKIYRSRHVIEREIAGYTALSGLLKEFALAGWHHTQKKPSDRQKILIGLLPPEVIDEIDGPTPSAYDVLRSIIDFVAGMTDRYVLSLYGKINAHQIG